MELREELKRDQHDSLLRVIPVQIPDFIMLGLPIETLKKESRQVTPQPNSIKAKVEQTTLFDHS
jgi:hypothetical protein